ncbi:MAG: DEAD/DEAH box helicase family protein [Proteobacteria bacterium]|nr:DEAD/DEAH box helicase family protein [Pseudomonadota bacterium]
MLLDNENKNLKVHEWLSKYTEEGTLDVVTGYFTVGALAYLSQEVNDKISEFRFVLGDIVNAQIDTSRALDLLNENITVESSLKLNILAREAVKFLQQDKVVAKTLEPNFCHAKAYLFTPENNDNRDNYFITGSSNLTEAGIGLKSTSNIELNIAESGKNNQYKELKKWFADLWGKPQAHKNKTSIDKNGAKSTKPFKIYLIEEIEKIFIEYTPKELYYKVLFELFGNQLLAEQDNPEFNRQVGRLENTVVYQILYQFQQKGVLSLIKMLQKYNGAILADAVGLGKTWSALAVMKFFQFQGREIVLICPKKLQHNWHRYIKHQNSKFEKDQFEFFIRFHTDMQLDRMEKYTDRSDKLFINDKPKLIVIDESHNLRNDKSQRYAFLVEKILKLNLDVKVLMLSATPINNSLNDIRNQFKLMVQGDNRGFADSLSIKNLDYTFRAAQKAFNEWRELEHPQISTFIKNLPDNFFRLTDALTVARTRKMIEGQQTGLNFPIKAKPENIFVTPRQIGNFESFEELFNHFPPMLSGYQPSFYAETEGAGDKDILHDEKQREFFLVKMMYILMVKRLESSWFSFYSTVEKIRDHHQNALNKIKAYQSAKKDIELDDENEILLFEDDDLEADVSEFTLGKKRKIKLSEIDAARTIEQYKRDLKKDIDALDNLLANLVRFDNKIKKEITKPNNHKSSDDKLQVLIEKIRTKQNSATNNYNKKIVIFTAYKDTAKYIFEQLKARGFNKIAMVSGSGSLTDTSSKETKNFELILQRFAPFTKLFKEQEWQFSGSQDDLTESEIFGEWITWLADNNDPAYKQIQKPIDILIATDTLSEGQNLQDADTVINYDIHWNPVRIIQRMGRIDRLGSPNKIIFGINFWPSSNINTYLNLQGRIEHRMAAMKLAGSEVHLEFSDTFAQMATDENLENRMKARMLEQMQTSWDDIETSERGLGFDNLSLERYRQDLLAEIKENGKKYYEMPKGVYTGFIADKAICSDEGIIALLGYPTRPPKATIHEYQIYELIYIDMNGKPVLLNQKEVLDALGAHKDKNRYVHQSVDKGEEQAIQLLADAIKTWLTSQAVEEEKQEDGGTKKRMGKEVKDILAKLRSGDPSALKKVKQNIKVSDKYMVDNFDLITWFLVS